MDERTAALFTWLRQHGFVWEAKLEIIADEPANIWVRSREALDVGDIVARIPKKACFTPRTCLPRTRVLVEELLALSKNRQVRCISALQKLN
jgi:hypothetical protein